MSIERTARSACRRVERMRCFAVWAALLLGGVVPLSPAAAAGFQYTAHTSHTSASVPDGSQVSPGQEAEFPPCDKEREYGYLASPRLDAAGWSAETVVRFKSPGEPGKATLLLQLRPQPMAGHEKSWYQLKQEPELSLALGLHWQRDGSGKLYGAPEGLVREDLPELSRVDLAEGLKIAVVVQNGKLTVKAGDGPPVVEAAALPHGAQYLSWGAPGWSKDLAAIDTGIRPLTAELLNTGKQAPSASAKPPVVFGGRLPITDAELAQVTGKVRSSLLLPLFLVGLIGPFLFLAGAVYLISRKPGKGQVTATLLRPILEASLERQCRARVSQLLDAEEEALRTRLDEALRSDVMRVYIAEALDALVRERLSEPLGRKVREFERTDFETLLRTMMPLYFRRVLETHHGLVIRGVIEQCAADLAQDPQGAVDQLLHRAVWHEAREQNPALLDAIRRQVRSRLEDPQWQDRLVREKVSEALSPGPGSVRGDGTRKEERPIVAQDPGRAQVAPGAARGQAGAPAGGGSSSAPAGASRKTEVRKTEGRKTEGQKANRPSDAFAAPQGVAESWRQAWSRRREWLKSQVRDGAGSWTRVQEVLDGYWQELIEKWDARPASEPWDIWGLRELDLYLYQAPESVLENAGQSDALRDSGELLELLDAIYSAQRDRKSELSKLGYRRIEGQPETDCWDARRIERDLAAEPEPTDRPELDYTYCEILPGRAGYEYRGETLDATYARFYRYQA